MKAKTELLDADGNAVTSGVTVKTISVTYERKQNMGDFSSANIGITLWADVEPEQDLHDACNALWQMAKENVKAQLLPLVAKQKAQTAETFLGLSVRDADNGNTKTEESDGA